MGVTITSKNYAMDMGSFGFHRLRKKVAELTGPEIKEHYDNLDKGIFLEEKESEKFFEVYDKKISELEETLKIPNGILDFLYMSDCSGSLSYSKCKQIYKVIENYNDDILYGYSGRKDCAKFEDFKRIIKDCIDTRRSMKWY